jgi:hypothetical protein
MFSIASLASTPPPSVIPATFFGMNVHGDPVLYPTVSIGNLGKESAAEWGWIEPNPPTGSGCPGTVNCTHTYNWATLDDYVAHASAHNVQFMFTWDESPPWATNNVGCSGRSPTQCTGPITDYPDFDAFVTALATRYNGQNGHGLISVFELYNENDYSGTPAQLAMQAEHYVVDIHAIIPTALIGAQVYGKVITRRGGTFDQFWSAWRAITGNHAHLDFVSYHGYDSGDPLAITGACGSTSSEFGRSSSSGYIDCIRQMIADNGLPANIPIWDTEGSWGNSVNSSFTIDQKKAYISQYYLLAWSLGVKQQMWYAWDNQSFGTLCTGGGTSCQPTSAATAYQKMYNWMVGSTMNVPCASNGTVWTCGLTNSAGVQTQAVWNTAGSSSYTVPAAYEHYQDLAGNTNPISGGTILIGIQPILLIP